MTNTPKGKDTSTKQAEAKQLLQNKIRCMNIKIIENKLEKYGLGGEKSEDILKYNQNFNNNLESSFPSVHVCSPSQTKSIFDDSSKPVNVYKERIRKILNGHLKIDDK